ncbi:UNVERIFIED_CONTAM: hypothetical protein GTU68_012138 [Idotea baltica]|nr:hypothetical protein [Idotea baltica]
MPRKKRVIWQDLMRSFFYKNPLQPVLPMPTRTKLRLLKKGNGWFMT